MENIIKSRKYNSNEILKKWENSWFLYLERAPPDGVTLMRSTGWEVKNLQGLQEQNRVEYRRMEYIVLKNFTYNKILD